MNALRSTVLIAAALLVAALASSAQARVDFGLQPFAVEEFRALDAVRETCGGPSPSFLCRQLDAELTRIPTKGVDVFFNDAGELIAAFAKQQKGQTINNYNLDNRQNLIPSEAGIPGGAVLLGGEYVVPEDVEGSWERLSDELVEGTFSYEVGGVAVEKTIRVSNIRHTLEVTVEAERIGAEGAAGDAETAEEGAGESAAAAEPLELQYAFPGIARVEDPVVKIGSGDDFSTNPPAAPFPDPSYVSIQNNNRNNAYAIVLRPDPQAAPEHNDDLVGVALGDDRVALQTALEPGTRATLDLEAYTGANELVRYYQEGYLDLPGLFSPNLLGRLSLGILWLLQTIHDYVGNWGLSIVVLTLLFRAAIWPLISTQTRSMYGMQELQPKIQALQKKHKDDREKLTQETMKLYKEAGVNPAGGCLPIVAQMPLFIILWRVFVNFEFAEGFLWIPDLGQADPFYILPILYVGVMLAQSWFSARGNPQSLRQQVLINVVFAFIIINFPAGVILYFVVSMLVQVFQYFLISRGRSASPATAG